MIVEALLDFIQGVVDFLIGLIPDVPFDGVPTELGDFMRDLGDKIAPMGAWVPFEFVAGIVGAVLAVRLAVAAFAVVMKIYTLVRGGG